MSAKVFPGRYTAEIEGDFVVFLIGMRFNRLRDVRQWWPVFTAMPKMLRWLEARPEAGLLSTRTALSGKTILMVQHWRTFEDLDRFARQADAPHLQPWREFNQKVRDSGAVGIWHETYRVRAGEYETVYGNMPRYGLAVAGEHLPVGSTAKHQTAVLRIGASDEDTPPVQAY